VYLHEHEHESTEQGDLVTGGVGMGAERQVLSADVTVEIVETLRHVEVLGRCWGNDDVWSPVFVLTVSSAISVVCNSCLVRDLARREKNIPIVGGLEFVVVVGGLGLRGRRSRPPRLCDPGAKAQVESTQQIPLNLSFKFLLNWRCCDQN
jgi:hypothetical protein